VYVLRGKTAQKQVVQTGLVSEGMMLIEKGLEPGDRVIERGATRVIDGEEVVLIES
jgi:hypothetical protein